MNAEVRFMVNLKQVQGVQKKNQITVAMLFVPLLLQIYTFTKKKSVYIDLSEYMNRSCVLDLL